MKPIFMFYNVENLFYPTFSNEQTFLPQPKNWTKERYQIKLKRITEVVSSISIKYKEKPLLIGVCEVQEKQIIEDLLVLPIFSDYEYIYSESLDERGMDTALLYLKNSIKIIHHKDFSFQGTRNILYSKIEFFSQILNIFTIHLPSKRNLDENKYLRQTVLKELKKIILENLSHSKEFVVILGDFNVNPNDESLMEIINLTENYKLFNPFSTLYGKHYFSTFHQDKGLLFDQMIISENFLHQNSILKIKQAEIFIADFLKKQGKPFRTFAGSRYLGGYSDHYPTILELEEIH